MVRKIHPDNCESLLEAITILRDGEKVSKLAAGFYGRSARKLEYFSLYSRSW